MASAIPGGPRTDTPPSALARGLSVQVLGDLVVRVDGQVRDFRGELRRRLLLTLLAAGERPVSADRLADALWGVQAHSINAVQAQVSRLRKLLDPEGHRAGGWLVSRPDGYLLRPDAFDLSTFEAHLDDGRACVTTEPEVALATLDQALRRWTPPVAADLLAWTARCREVEVRVLGAEDMWCDLASRLGAASLVDRVVDLARAQPARELRWALAMQGLARTGRRAEALALYREVARALRDEHGIDPGRELRLMHQTVLRQESEVPVDTVEAGVRLTLSPPPQARTSFVGRQLDLERLEMAVAQCRVVTVTGLGGMGKSRLVSEWVARSGRTGVCHWVTLRGTGPGELLPRIAEGLGLSTSEDASLLDTVSALLRTRPVLLVVDNADEAGAEGAALLTSLIEQCPQLTLLLTARHSAGVLGERTVPLPPLTLSPGPTSLGSGNESADEALGRSEAGQLAAARLDPAARDADVARVAALSGGVPLAIELLAATGAHDSATLETPTGQPLETIIATAVDELAPDTASLFTALLDLPDGAPGDLVAHLAAGTGSSVGRQARLIRELVGGSLVVTVPMVGAGGPTVRHRVLPPIAELRTAWVTSERTRTSHEAFAAWLRHRVGVSWAAPPRRASYLSLLDESATFDAVFRWYAANTPAELLPLAIDLVPFLRWAGQTRQAAQWLTLALAEGGDPVNRAKGLLLLTQGQGLGHMSQGIALVQEAIDLLASAGVGNGLVMAVALAQRAVGLGWSGDLAGFDASLTAARAAADPDDAWFHAHCDSAYALSQLLRGDPEHGIDLALRSADDFLELGDPDAALVSVHFALQLAGWAALPADRMVALFERGGEISPLTRPHTQALLAGARAQFALKSGSDDAVPALLSAIRLTEQVGNLRTAGVGRRDLGLYLLRSGERARARAQLRLAAERLVVLDTGSSALALAGLARALEDTVAAKGLRADLATAAWAQARVAGGSTVGVEEEAAMVALIGPPKNAPVDELSARELARAALARSSLGHGWSQADEAEQLEQDEAGIRRR